MNKVICLFHSFITHSKVIQGAALLECFHNNKHIPSHLLWAESMAALHIRDLSSNGEVRALFLCTRPQETQNSTQASSWRSASHSPAVMRCLVSANQRNVCRFDENAQRCRSLLSGSVWYKLGKSLCSLHHQRVGSWGKNQMFPH